MSDNVRTHIIVEGLVQGVFFRASARSVAMKCGVKGWVKNRPDGRVEAVFEGKRRDVEDMVEWCRNGPPGARVERIDIEWEEYKGDFNDFNIKY